MDSPSLQHIHPRRQAYHKFLAPFAQFVHLTQDLHSLISAKRSHWNERRLIEVDGPPHPLSQTWKLAMTTMKGSVMTPSPLFTSAKLAGHLSEEEELAGLRICPRLQPIEVDAAREVRTIELH